MPVEIPDQQSLADLVREHRELFEQIADMDDEAPELADQFGKAPLRYLEEADVDA